MVSRSAGSFLGGILNNPGAVALGAIAIGLFIFRRPIQEAFASVGESLGNLGNINVSLPEVSLPEVSIPEIGGFQLPDFITNIFNPPAAPEQIILQGEPQERGGGISESIVLTPIRNIIESIMPTGTVQTQIPDQQFFGGGPSFIGGTIFETPIERLSLGQITEQQDISASLAASLRAEAIGFTEAEQQFLNVGQEISPLGDLGPQTSNLAFGGLSPEEIALRLTGGNISNF